MAARAARTWRCSAAAQRDFLGEFLPFRHGIPSHDTFSRVFRLLAPDPFRRCFVAFMRCFAEASREEADVVALDGKTVRRSFDRAAPASPLHPGQTHVISHLKAALERGASTYRGRGQRR